MADSIAAIIRAAGLMDRGVDHLPRSSTSIIYKATGNLPAVQILLRPARSRALSDTLTLMLQTP